MRKRMMLGVAFGLATIAAGGADAHPAAVSEQRTHCMDQLFAAANEFIFRPPTIGIPAAFRMNPSSRGIPIAKCVDLESRRRLAQSR